MRTRHERLLPVTGHTSDFTFGVFEFTQEVWLILLPITYYMPFHFRALVVVTRDCKSVNRHELSDFCFSEVEALVPSFVLPRSVTRIFQEA